MVGFKLLCGCFCHVHRNDVRKPSADRFKSLKRNDDEISILFLGRTEVGKTTIIRNLCMNYGSYDELYHPLPDPCTGDFLKEKGRPLVYFNLLHSFSKLVTFCLREGYTFDDVATAQLAEGFLENAKANMELPVLGEGIKDSLCKLWSDSAIQLTYANRRKHRVTGNVKYFIEHIERISDPEYLPTADDLLRVRVNTVEPKEHHFKVDGYKYCLTDVGGTTSQRSRWVNAISEFCEELLRTKSAAKVVIFVASLGDYNQERKPYEAESSDNINIRYNRPYTDMDESLNLFRLLIDCEQLMGKKIILFLNKFDVFETRLSEFHDFRAVYPDAATDDDPIVAKKYVRGLFETEMRCSRFRNSEDLRTLFTTATDRNIMKAVFNTTKEQIIEEIVFTFAGGAEEEQAAESTK